MLIGLIAASVLILKIASRYAALKASTYLTEQMSNDTLSRILVKESFPSTTNRGSNFK